MGHRVILRATPFVAVFVALLAIYWQTLAFDYVWDDRQFLLMTGWFRDDAVWFGKIFAPFFVSDVYFRPLTLLTFIIDTRVFDTAPRVSHAISILLLCINTGLVAALAAAQIRDNQYKWLWAALAAAIYATHPTLVETYAWVSGRFDALMSLFFLLGLLVDRLARNIWLRASFVSLCFLAAALSKEMAAPFPAVLLLQHLLVQKPQSIREYLRSADAKVVAASIAAGFIYLGLRANALPDLLPTGELRHPGHWLNHLALIAASFAEYAKLTFWPFATYSPMHPTYLPVGILDPRAVAGTGLFALVGAGIWLSWHRGGNGWIRTLIPLAAMSPVMNIVLMPIGQNIVHERFLCLPLALAAAYWIPGLAMAKPPERVRRRLTIAIVALVFTSIISINFLNSRLLATIWGNEYRLWNWAYRATPDSREVRSHMIVIYAQQGESEKARQMATELASEGYMDPAIMANIGIMSFDDGDYENSELELENALANSRPKNTLLHGLIQAQLGRTKTWLCKTDEARAMLRQAYETDPGVTNTLINLAAFTAVFDDTQASRRFERLFLDQVPQRFKSNAVADLENQIDSYTQAKAHCAQLSETGGSQGAQSP